MEGSSVSRSVSLSLWSASGRNTKTNTFPCLLNEVDIFHVQQKRPGVLAHKPLNGRLLPPLPTYHITGSKPGHQLRHTPSHERSPRASTAIHTAKRVVRVVRCSLYDGTTLSSCRLTTHRGAAMPLVFGAPSSAPVHASDQIAGSPPLASKTLKPLRQAVWVTAAALGLRVWNPPWEPRDWGAKQRDNVSR